MRKTIAILLFFVCSISIGQTKAQWKTRFDYYWSNTSHSGMYANKNFMMDELSSNGAYMEHYYGAWAFHAALDAFRATGDLNYLNDMFNALYAVIGTATVVPISGGTFYGWPGIKEGNYVKGVPLWESYLWRFVATLMRVMYQSPNLRAMNNGSLAGTTYQDNYNYVLGWMEHNIWDKWYSDGIGNMYRINTHMASHWARIGIELYTITGESKYKDVFDDISYAGMPNRNNQSIRSRIYNIGDAYSWYQSFTETDVSDTNHGSDVMEFIVNAAEQGQYWTLEDVQKFANEYKNTIWYNNSPVQYTEYVNGSGTGAAVDLGSWLSLARFDSDLMARANTYFYPNIPAGNYAEGAAEMLLNTAYHTDTVVYPENNNSGGGTPPTDVTAPVVTSYNVEELTETGFKLRWYLDEPSKGWVVFGTTSHAGAANGSVTGSTYPNATAHETGYYLTHGQGPGFSPNTGFTLTAGTTYYFRFRVKDAAGNASYSNEHSITTLSDGTPVITLTGKSTLNYMVGATYTEQGATWNDGTSTGAATVGGDTVDKDSPGTYVVSYSKSGAETIYRHVIYSEPITVRGNKSLNLNILFALEKNN